MTTALITGATGFLGQEVVRCLLERDRNLQLLCLIRSRDGASLEQRRQKLMRSLPAEAANRVHAIGGDIECPRLGLDDHAYASLLERVDRVVHVAATTRFDHSLPEARRINVGGTMHALELARQLRKAGRLGRLDYVGTAYVAGDRTDLVLEQELDVGQGFRNTYEQSKFEAEKLCRAAQQELPVCILRPSIIVGDSRTGRTTSYKTLYWPMRLLIGFYGLWRPVLPRLVRLPVRPDCVLDVVPVDWVAEAVARLFEDPGAVGRCYHLAAGPDAATIECLVNLACDHFGVARLRYLDPEGPARYLGQAIRPVLEQVAPQLTHNILLMMAYTRRNPRFDVRNARDAGLTPPPVQQYFTRLINFAYSHDFGRL
ncbi:MAG: SDR family oxidoreductase [Myxococcales bacterium]|nr:SDR family oxidoreductase [Myxococcota bacterium]MDW8283989.1 SDR family oxidoreductase [Myxococcales bacterium]